MTAPFRETIPVEELATLVTVETAERLAARAHEAINAGQLDEARRLLVALCDETSTATASRVKVLAVSGAIAQEAALRVRAVLDRQVPELPERTWTFLGHWRNDRIVVTETVTGEVTDPREADDRAYPEGLWAASGTGTDTYSVQAMVVGEYEGELHGMLWVCDDCLSKTGVMPVCQDGCFRGLEHDGPCHREGFSRDRCQNCGQVGRLSEADTQAVTAATAAA